MKKPLLSRIFALVFVYCVVFFFVVLLQFSSKGNFSLPAGLMTIRGRYLPTNPPKPTSDDIEISGDSQETENIAESSGKAVVGGIKVFFGGLEFNLKEDRERGLTITDAEGVVMPVNPEYMIKTDDSARFVLPGGTAIVFSSFDSARGSELHINAEFAADIAEAAIYIVPRRSSLIRDNGQSGILYNGARYFFGASGHELETGRIVLSRADAAVAYRARGKQKIFDPADYTIANAPNYASALAEWQEASYSYWNQNAATLQYEDDITAYCSEALKRGSFPAAISSISSGFINGPQNSFRSSSFVGGITTTQRAFIAAEREKLNQITQLTREKSLDVLKEKHILDYLLSRNSTALANEVINLINAATPEQLTPEYCPGLLEFYRDLKQWRPSAANPVDALSQQILLLVSENLSRDANKDLVYASNGEGMDLEFSLRLGKALADWAQSTGNAQWESVGRSLVLSALTTSGPGAGKLYNILSPADYYPRASLLADNGLWAWTVSPSARASYAADGNLNITFAFPANMSHYVKLSGVRPFVKIQLHDMDWRTDSQFERYNSSGWLYYPQDQVLILKLRHRVAVETVRIIYRAEVPPPPPAREEEAEEADGDAIAQ